MFRSNTARRRTGLLASSSLVASTLAGGGALLLTAFTPGAALAGGCVTALPTTTCSGIDPAIETITVASNPQNINFETYTNVQNTAGAVFTVNAAGQTVNLDYNEGSPNTPSDVVNSGVGDALVITDPGGNVNVFSEVTTGGAGLLAGGTTGTGLVVNNQAAGAGNISVTVVDSIITGGAVGIHTLANAGTTTINVASTGAVSATTGTAILASGAGHIAVTGSGTVTGGTSGDGIQIQSKGGITVSLNGNISGDPGINVTDTSVVGINLTPGNVSGVADGIKAIENGAGPIHIAPTGNVSASAGTGILVIGKGTGNITTTGHTVTGTGGVGINAKTTGDLTINAGVTTSTTLNGILANSGGNLTVNTAGKTTGGGTFFGLFATTSSATGNVSVTTVGDVINGIFAGGATTTGATTVVVNGNVTVGGVQVGGGSLGTEGKGSGNVTINSGNVTGGLFNLDAIEISEVGNVSLTMAAGTSATAAQPGFSGVHLNSASGTITGVIGGNVSGALNGILTTDAGTSGADSTGLAVGPGSTVTGTTGAGISTSTVAGNVLIILGGGDTISGKTAGVTVSSTGAGSITVLGAPSAQVAATVGDGIDAIEQAGATGAVLVVSNGNVSAGSNIGSIGIKAQILNAADANDVTVASGNVTSNGNGIQATTAGAGNVSVTVGAGANVTSNGGTGVVATAALGGNATVTLLGGNVAGGAGFGFGAGIVATATGAGAATIDQSGAVSAFTLLGLPAELATSVNGPSTVNVNGNVTNSAGLGAEALVTGTGPATVSLFNNTVPVGPAPAQAATIAITTSFGGGVLASNNDTAAVTVATVNAQAGAGVLTLSSVASGTSITGIQATSAGTLGSKATVDLSNLAGGSSVFVNGPGAGDTGILASATGALPAGAGTATVITGKGLTVNVGTTTVAVNDVGVEAVTSDHNTGANASVTLGATNTVNVGGAGGIANGLVGVEAILTTGGVDTVSVTGGAKDVVLVQGQAAAGSPLVGVQALGGGGPTSVTLGDGGSVTVNDTLGGAKAIDFGVLAQTQGFGPATVKIGTTTVSDNNGEGVRAVVFGGAGAVLVNDNGNVTSSGIGIEAFGGTTGNVTVNYNTTGTQSATLTVTGSGSAGIFAHDGPGGNVSVTLGNATGLTDIVVDNTAFSNIGVEALTFATGNVIIHNIGNIRVEPTQYGESSISGAGQAGIDQVGTLTVIVNDPLVVSANKQHIGLFATTQQTAGTSSAFVSLGGPTNILVNVAVPAGNPLGGSIGIAAVDNSGGAVKVTTAAIGIEVGGQNSAGVVATTVGGDGGGTFFTDGAGSNANVTVNLGTGLIQVGVSNPGGADLSKDFAQGYGVFATSFGGNVGVSNAASMAVNNGTTGGTVGIFANTTANGAITVLDTSGGTIATARGDGILASHTGGGSGTVSVGTVATPVTASIQTGNVPGIGLIANGFGNGIEAVTNGGGAILVDQGLGATSTITTFGTAGAMPDVGIFAHNTGGLGGTVTVTTAGQIVTNEAGGGVSNVGVITVAGQGVIATTNGFGAVTVNQGATGNITTAASDGIDAVNTSHANGTVTVNASGIVNAKGATGIVALTTSNDAVAINLNGATVTGGNGFGALADIISGVAGTGTVKITTTGATTVAGSLGGLGAFTNGSGLVTVNVGAGSNISSSNGTGITAINSGFGSANVTVINSGNVTSQLDGIDAQIIQFANNGVVSVTTGNITSKGTGVLAQTAGTGTVKVTTTAGTTINAAGGGGGGINAQGLAGGNVQVTTVAGSTVQGKNFGILAQAIGTGTTTVTSAGNVSTVNFAGISAITQNGLDTVKVTGGTVSSTNGRGVSATTSGSGSIAITTSAGSTVKGGTGGAANDGIFASPGVGGSINITLNGAATTGSPALSWGVNAVGSGSPVTVTEGATGSVTDGGIRAVNLPPGGTATVNLSGSTTNTARQGVLAQNTSGTLTVNLKGAATVNGATNGVEEDSVNGPIVFTGQGGTSIKAGLNGILANATGNGGTVNVNEAGAITATSGDGILAETTNAAGGSVIVQTGAGAIVSTGLTGTAGVFARTAGPSSLNVTDTGPVTGFSGVAAVSQGGNVIINTSGVVKGTGGITPFGTTTSSVGVGGATTGAGTVNIVTTGNVSSAGDFGVVGSTTGAGSVTIATGNVSGNEFGVLGSGSGGGAVTVTTNGAVSASNPGVGLVAVEGTSAGGAVIIKTNSTVTGAFDGVFGTSTGAGTVNIDTTGGLVTASGGSGFGVGGQTANGALTITTGAVTGTGGGAGTTGILGNSTGGAITISDLGAVNATNAGIAATSSTGAIGITTGPGATVTATAVGISATTGGPSITITTGAAVTGSSGIVTIESGGAAATTTITTTSGLVTATSTSGFGVSATAGGPTTVTTGAVSANAGGATSTATAISAISTGGPVLVNAQGAIQGGLEGIVATSGPASSVTVNTSSTVTASNGGGIAVNAGSGGGFVNVGGNVVATDANSAGVGIGVSDTSTGVANVVVTGGSSVTSTGAKATFGIFASGGTGVTVDTTAGGTVTGQTTGISTTDAAGPTVITTGVGAVVGTTADGIDAVTTGAGPITITTNGTVTGAVNGVVATGAGGAVTVTNNALVTGTSGKGISASDTGAGVIQVVINAPITDAVGVFTAQTGSGVTNIVDTNAANTVTGTVGDGIQAVNGAGTGAVNVGSGPGSRFVANVTGATNGIDISGAGPMNVFTSSTITGGTLWGILAQSTGAAVTIDVTGPVTDGPAGKGGIKGATSGANAVSITSTSTVTGLGAGSDGIFGISTGAGAVTIAATGPSVTGANDAIHASSAGGAITVGTAAAPITSVLGDKTTLNAAIQTVNTTGTTLITTAASASMSGDVNAAFGIEAASTSGLITIANAAPITVNGTDISAAASAGGAITVATSGTLNATTGDGIDAISSGAGNGTVTVGTAAAPITSNITVANNGIVAQGNGIVGVVDSGSITGKTGQGIFARSTSGAFANATVSVTTSGAIKDAVGILASTTGTDKGDTVTVNVSGPVTATAGTGIAGIGVNGLVTVNLTAAGVTSTGGDGIIGASSGTGSVVVNTSAGTTINTSGAGADGIFATISNAASLGTITVNNAATITMANGTFAGIQVLGLGKGNAVVNNSGVIDPAAFGINMVNGGNATVNTSANVTGGVGILTETTGAAPFTAQTNVTGGAVITGLTGSAIQGFGVAGGNVGVNTQTSGNITGAADGIQTAVTGGTGTTTINTLAPAVGGNNLVNALLVSGSGGDGIDATSTGSGAISITSGNATGSGLAANASDGIFAASTGGGAVSVTTVGNVLGDVTGNVAGTGGAGIQASSNSANVTVNSSAPVKSNGAVPPVFAPVTTAVSGGNYGIFASSGGAGATTVTSGVSTNVGATGLVTANGTGPVGIDAIGGTGGAAVGKGTGVTVTTNALVAAANGRGIVTSSANNAVINVNATSVVLGLGDATAAFGGAGVAGTHPVIDVTAVSGATTTINDAGMVGSVRELTGNTIATQVAGLSDLALRGTTGSVVVNDTNALDGRVDFSGVTGANSVTINVTSPGGWLVNGSNAMDPTGANTINNTGVIATSINQVATSFAFGSGTNAINNNAGGLFVVGSNLSTSGSAAAPAVTTITGAVTFTNNGTIILGSAFGGSKSDGIINAVLIAKNTQIAGAGIIDLDANLWSTPQSAAACTTASLTAADCIVVGSSAGNNGLRVTDTGAHAFGAFNPTGITVVVGSSGASTFHIDPGSSFFDGNPADASMFGGHTGVINKPGLFFYDLAFFSSDATERLVGVPKAPAFEFASLGGGVDDLWYTTTQTWFDRQADLRDGLEGRSTDVKPGVWLKIIGDWTSRNHTNSLTLGSQTFTFNTSYNQDTSAIIGGIDILDVTQRDMAFVAGLELGEVNSDIRFKATPDRFKISGSDFGGYVTFLDGGLFIDGTINANFLKLNGDVVGLGGGGSPQNAVPILTGSRVNAVGGQIEAGYSMSAGSSFFWEPLGTLSYVNASFDAIQLPGSGGGLQQITNDRSFRGSLGLRFGGDETFQYYKVKVALTARVWDEFDGNTLSTLIVAAGPNFTNNDRLRGIFGEVQGEANLFTTTSGLSAFLNGGYKFKSSYSEGTITLGARYQW